MFSLLLNNFRLVLKGPVVSTADLTTFLLTLANLFLVASFSPILPHMTLVFSSLLNFLKSFLTLSRNLYLVPCAGCVGATTQTESYWESFPPLILLTCPIQHKRLAIIISYKDSIIPKLWLSQHYTSSAVLQ